MFTRLRKARVLFGLSDIILVTLAFQAAYQKRAVLHLHFEFYLTAERKALVLGFALVAWVTIGLWLEIYEKLDSRHPRVILRDTVRQCAYGGLCLVLFEYLLRLDLSRFFLGLFSVVGTGERAIRMAEALEQSRLLVKRAIDIAIAAAGLIVRAPFMAVISILIRLTSPGPVIFRQVRRGLNDRRFLFYKFRSMCQNAEELRPIGRYLRKFSIDEWPQLWNVLRGEMSLVGPRPAVPSEVEQLPALAAVPPEDAPRFHLPVGHFRTRQRGFRNLDEAGYAVH
jgi:hypothetical protein